MHITFKMDGGLAYFPGLNRPVTFDVDRLPQDQADALRQQVSSAGFFDLPSQVGTPRQGAADYRQYTLTISEGDRHHTVRCFDPVAGPALQTLLGTLRQMARPKP